MLTLPYDVKSIPRGGQARCFAFVQCGTCDAHCEHTLTGVHNPEMVVKHIRRLGWSIDFGPARHNRCPTCANRRRPTSDPDALLRKKVETMSKPIGMQGSNGSAVARALGEQRGDVPPLPPPHHDMPRDLTADEKAAVRRLLDTHFDDSKGLYLDGYFDRRVGEECNVPAACVARLRELAYGPIRVDPEIAAIRQEAVDLQAKLTALCDRIKAVEARSLGKAA